MFTFHSLITLMLDELEAVTNDGKKKKKTPPRAAVDLEGEGKKNALMVAFSRRKRKTVQWRWRNRVRLVHRLHLVFCLDKDEKHSSFATVIYFSGF